MGDVVVDLSLQKLELKNGSIFSKYRVVAELKCTKRISAPNIVAS
jgi:hypothetical protein